MYVSAGNSYQEHSIIIMCSTQRAKVQLCISLTLQMFCALMDQALVFHCAFRSLSTQALRTMLVGAVYGNLMRYLVRCRLFNLYS